jgi:hypothetical protein
MTYLVSEKDKADLYATLNVLAGMADVMHRALPNTGAAEQEVINSLRQRIGRWAALSPVVSEIGTKTEILDSDMIAECSIHGLFFTGASDVDEEDCPECAHEITEEDLALADADRRYHERKDAEVGA